MKRKVLWLLSILSFVICVCFLFSACNNNSATIEQIEGATINDKKIFMFVSSDTNEVSLSDKVKCSKGSSWKLYYDNLGQTEIPTKIATGKHGNLQNGNNIFYIVVNSKDGTSTNTYELTIHRSFFIQISFYDDNILLKSENVYTGIEYRINYAPNLIGYTFNGWETSYGENVTAFTPWESIKLYVKKTSITFTATLDVNGGDVLDNNSVTLNYGEETTLIVPTREHYDFIGWFVGDVALTDNSGKTLTNWEVPVSQVITAHWEIQKFSVILLINDDEAGTVTGAGKYEYGETAIVVGNTNSGYNFLGWYDSNDKLVTTDIQYSFVILNDTILTAKWNYYTLTINKNLSKAGTTNSFINNKISVGEEVTLSSKTNIGYTWLGWYVNNKFISSETTYSFSMCNYDIEITATWEVDKKLANFSYDLTDNTCKITGIIDKTVTEISVPEYVTYISLGAFSGCSNLLTLTVPFVGCSKPYYDYDSSTNFFGCIFGLSEYAGSTKTIQSNPHFSGVYYIPTKLKFVNVLDGKILNGAFGHCNNITDITINGNLTSIGDSAFYNCINLITVVLPNSVTNIGKQAFSNCTNLKNINLGNNIEKIGNNAFSYCESLTNINIGNKVTDIGDGTFYRCKKLSFVSFGENITTIGKEAFRECTALKSIVLPKKIFSIGDYAFYYTGINKVYFTGENLDWTLLNIGIYNSTITNANVYCYSEIEPTESGYYWHYVDGAPSIWI